MSDRELLEIVAALGAVGERPAAARRLAGWMGGDGVLLATRDVEVDAVLPGLGFPPTLPAGGRWQALFGECVRHGRASAELPFPGAAQTRVTAVRIGKDTVMAVAGTPDEGRLAAAADALALTAPLFALERELRATEARVSASERTAWEATALATALERSRAELQRALADAETARRAAEAAHRTKDEFLAVVSHELRTPLSAILGYSVMLRTGHLAPDETLRAVRVIERNARVQVQLIDDLLDFARLTTGKLSLDLAVVDPGTIARDAVETIRPAAEESGIELVLHVAGEPGPVHGDEGRLRQVLINLLANSLKFTPRGGHIGVAVERGGDRVQITVRDDGAGIEAEALPWIFEPFRQAAAGSARGQGGLGLGLSITRHLVEAHGGTVQVSSEGRDRGSQFVIRLPLADLRGAAGSASAPEREGLPDIAGTRVLVVDDHDDGRAVVTEILRQAGTHVMAVDSAAAALRVLDEQPVDIVLCDLEMPGRDGYDLLAAVRQRPDGVRQVPFVAVSAYTESVHHGRALRAGFMRFVQKPVDPETLIEIVGALRRPALRASAEH